MSDNIDRKILEDLLSGMEESYDQWYQDNKGTLNPPPLDLSYMKYNPELLAGQDLAAEGGQLQNCDWREEQSHKPDSDSFAETCQNQPRNIAAFSHRLFSLRSLRFAAAFFLAVVLFSSVMTVWVNSNVAHALKFRIEKFLYETVNHQYSTNVNGGNDENLISMKVTDPDQIKTLQQQIPDLLIPESLPEGYTFSYAEADYWKNGNWLCRISYKNEEGKTINVVEENSGDSSDIYSKINDAEELKTSIGKVYYMEENESLKGLFYLKGNVLVQISGTVEKGELLQILSGIK